MREDIDWNTAWDETNILTAIQIQILEAYDSNNVEVMYKGVDKYFLQLLAILNFDSVECESKLKEIRVLLYDTVKSDHNRGKALALLRDLYLDLQKTKNKMGLGILKKSKIELDNEKRFAVAKVR